VIPVTRDYLKLHFIVLLFGFTAVLGKLISLPSVEMVFYRTLLAALGMSVLMILFRKSFTVSKSDLIKILLTSIIVSVHWITFFVSGKISNPSTSLVGFATCSFWAAILDPLAKGKKIQLLEIGLGIVVLAGLCIILAFDFRYPLGLFLGVISGLTAAWFTVINSKIVSRVSTYTITFYEMVGACAFIVLFMPIYKATWAAEGELNLIPTAIDWVYILIIAWACSVYAYSVAIELTKKLSVFFIQLALNLEPVYGILLALLIFGESEVMSLKFYAGTLIILSAVVLYPIMKRKSKG
jgi:drug/metabolite transporter (DMT)-like permease